MKTHLFLLTLLLPLLLACGVQQNIPTDGANHTYCSTEYNFCLQYPAAVLPSPEAGTQKSDLLLGLYGEENDIRLLLAADQNAQSLSFEQIYETQMNEWSSTYDDVDEEASNITSDGYDVSARADGYYLYAKSMKMQGSGRYVHLRLVGGPELNELLFAELKKKILIYPNQ